MMTVAIDRLRIPESIHDPDAGDFVETVALRTETDALVVGSRDLAWTPNEILVAWKNEYEPKIGLIVRMDERIVALGVYEVQTEAGADSAWISIDVLPHYRGRGIGTAVHERLADMAARDGRSALQGLAFHSPHEIGDPIDSPSGVGRVFAGDPGVRFARSHGYRLAQVVRMSRLDLPVAFTAPMPPEGYDLEFWEGRTPSHRLDDLARLHASMSTDTPLGDLDLTPEVWDGERVVTADDRELASGRRLLTVAARHIATDSLVGFSSLGVPAELHRPALQGGTIVSPAHRGHRLGMLMKLANLVRLDQLAPGHPSIYTWNAEENRHMLVVNEAVGFRAAGLEAGWRREI